MTSRAQRRIAIELNFMLANAMTQGHECPFPSPSPQFLRDAARVLTAQSPDAAETRRLKKEARAARKAAELALRSRMLAAKARPPPERIVRFERVLDALHVFLNDPHDTVVHLPHPTISPVLHADISELPAATAMRHRPQHSAENRFDAAMLVCSDGSSFVWSQRDPRADLWTFSLGSACGTVPPQWGHDGVRDFTSCGVVAEQLFVLLRSWHDQDGPSSDATFAGGGGAPAETPEVVEDDDDPAVCWVDSCASLTPSPAHAAIAVAAESPRHQCSALSSREDALDPL